MALNLRSTCCNAALPFSAELRRENGGRPFAEPRCPVQAAALRRNPRGDAANRIRSAGLLIRTSLHDVSTCASRQCRSHEISESDQSLDTVHAVEKKCPMKPLKPDNLAYMTRERALKSFPSGYPAEG
jgi:hypothetical protein